jgi:hypothetical protein
VCGDTELLTAERVGISDRQLRNWKTHALWPEALAEAEKRWFPDTRRLAMGTIRRHIQRGNVAVAQWFAERQIRELAPPRTRLEHTGKDGGPIETEISLRDVARSIMEVLRQAQVEK